MDSSDLSVKSFSDALKGKKIDVIVCGSIGAVECVRFIRSLRRLGAEIFPWLTKGGSQFITSLSLEWASANKVTTDFSGTASHIAEGDACVIAPASANFIYKIAHGITDSPAAALVASYLGQKKKVIIVPNMHESLFNSPGIQENLKKIRPWGVILAARKAEGKQKFPEPAVLADHVSHEINKTQKELSVLVTMGSTRGYVDDVRHISNYSSGALGTFISEELYRRGLEVLTVAGTCPIMPQAVTNLTKVLTIEEMLSASQKAIDSGVCAAVFAASVLDFVPAEKVSGKIRSTAEHLTLHLKSTDKIIGKLTPKVQPALKVGFKLETDLAKLDVKKIAKEYMDKYQLSQFVMNQLSDVSANSHKAVIYERGFSEEPKQIDGKRNVSQHICQQIIETLKPYGEATPS